MSVKPCISTARTMPFTATCLVIPHGISTIFVSILMAFTPHAVHLCSSTPIFFILFPGYSPSKEIEAYANQLGKTVENGKLTLISMGQGQEGPAEAVLDRWVG